MFRCYCLHCNAENEKAYEGKITQAKMEEAEEMRKNMPFVQIINLSFAKSVHATAKVIWCVSKMFSLTTLNDRKKKKNLHTEKIHKQTQNNTVMTHCFNQTANQTKKDK